MREENTAVFVRDPLPPALSTLFLSSLQTCSRLCFSRLFWPYSLDSVSLVSSGTTSFLCAVPPSSPLFQGTVSPPEAESRRRRANNGRLARLP